MERQSIEVSVVANNAILLSCEDCINFALCRAAFTKVACRIVFSFTQYVVDFCGFWMMSGFYITSSRLLFTGSWGNRSETSSQKIVVLKTPIFALLLSVTHHTKNIMGQKVFLILFMQCRLVFHLFFSFKLFVQKETLLRRLEDNVESEMGNWQKIVERTQRELKEVIIIILSFIHSWNDLPSISFQ